MQYRFCPSCGGALERRSLKATDPDRLVCQACGFVFYLDPKVAVGTIITVGDSSTHLTNGRRERAQRREPGERPAFARRASARSRHSLGGGGSEPAKRRASETVGESEGQSPSDEKRLVLVRRAIDPGYGLWVFPGGFVDRGEELTKAAIREAREESGLEVRLDRLVNIYSYPDTAVIIVVYAATAMHGELCGDDECLEARLFRADEIPWDELAFKSTREALRDYLDGVRVV